MPGAPVSNLGPFAQSHCSVCGAHTYKVEDPNASVSKLLTEAAGYSETYDWLTASDFQEKALGQLVSHESTEEPTIHELLGRSYFNGAFQSENREEFKQKIRRAEQHYGTAKAAYERLDVPALAQRAEAGQYFARYWHSYNFTDRKLQIEKCLSLAKSAVSSFDGREQQWSIDQTWLDLLTYVVEKFVYLPDRGSLVAHYKEAVGIAENAVSHLERAGESEELLEAIYLALWTLSYPSGFVLKPGTFEKSRQKRERLASRALQCPWHGSMFDIRTGQVTVGPVSGPELDYEVKLEGTDILARQVVRPGRIAENK